MSEDNIKATYLLAVWGEPYIEQFMDISLRSLLAPGNIPALAQQTESRFIFLTLRSDRKLFAAHPMFQRLTHYCRVEFVDIDDLIFDCNYSATLTLAYERGMRHAGESMLSTYFLYLVADYIMADGSLANLLPYMQRGVSGITAGNFQVVEEGFLDIVQARIDPTTGILSMPPRELIALSFAHLHPLTVANIVNQPFSHTDHTNRLFWRAGNDTLVGRFYLRHMLCIKPELDDYIIGSSCDYSYIAEMCPSGNVVHLADSDEYCVVEMQPFSHEQQFIRNGKLEPKTMAKKLSEWVTRAHRDNIAYPVIYHAQDIPSETTAILQESHDFVTHIEQQLPTESQPVRGHPYWISCIEAVLEYLMRLKGQTRYFKNGVFAGVVGSPVFEPPLGAMSGDYNLLRTNRYLYGVDWRTAIIRRLQAMVDNAKVNCKFWYSEYAHSRAIKQTLRQIADRNDRFMLITHVPLGYARWCLEQFGNRAVLQKHALFDLRPVDVLRAENTSHAVIFLPISHIHLLGKTLSKCGACLTGERLATVIVTQPDFSLREVAFRNKIAPLAAFYDGTRVTVESFTVVTGPLRKWLDGLHIRWINTVLQRSLSPRAMLRRFIALLLSPLLFAGYTCNNLLSRRRPYPRINGATCAIIQLRINP